MFDSTASVSDKQLTERGLPEWYTSHYHEYGKEEIVGYTVKTAIPFFQEAFPGCTAVFALDNSTDHSSYAPDTPRVEKLNK